MTPHRHLPHALSPRQHLLRLPDEEWLPWPAASAAPAWLADLDPERPTIRAVLHECARVLRARREMEGRG